MSKIASETVEFVNGERGELVQFDNFDENSLRLALGQLQIARESMGWQAVGFSQYGAIRYEKAKPRAPGPHEFFNPAGTWMDGVSPRLLYRLWVKRGKPGIFREPSPISGEILHIPTPYGDLTIFNATFGYQVVSTSGLYFRHHD